MLTAYEFSPSMTFSPCTPTGPGGVPAGSGGPVLRFDIGATQVISGATPYTVYAWNGVANQWEQDNALVTSDGSGGFFVTMVVCHFSEYAIMGPAMVPPRSVGGIAKPPPVAALASPTSDPAAWIRLSAIELSIAAIAMLGLMIAWRRRRRRGAPR